MKVLWFLLSLCLLSLAAETVRGQPGCVAPPPCSCSGPFVYCQHLNLTAVPTFREATEHIQGQLKVYLQGNRISNIPADAFSKLATTRSPDMYIDLSNNHITDIHGNAFRNITHTLHILRLSNNKLASISKVLGTLKTLHTLEIDQNEIKVFDIFTMKSLGHSLTSFKFGAVGGFRWPAEFQYLSKLHTLGINEFPAMDIPPTAFNGFDKTLLNLNIENTELDAVPQAICTLVNLESFTFNFNSPLVVKVLHVPTCSPALSSLGEAVFFGNNLTVFPDVFVSFPNLVSLRVASNPYLKKIDKQQIPPNLSLYTFELDSNALEQIPTVISTIHTLQSLDLSFNKLSSIGDSDLANLTSLVFLTLNNNSIAKISDSAFKSSQKLVSLDMSGNLFTTFPKAVRDLKVLRTLVLPDKQIDCNCGMVWILTQWRHGLEATVYITGYCARSTHPIKVYITQDLPSCPHM